MDIAAMSINLSQMKFAQEVSISVMEMAMDSSQENANMLSELLDTNVQAMEKSITPHLGNTIDIRL